MDECAEYRAAVHVLNIALARANGQHNFQMERDAIIGTIRRSTVDDDHGVDSLERTFDLALLDILNFGYGIASKTIEEAADIEMSRHESTEWKELVEKAVIECYIRATAAVGADCYAIYDRFRLALVSGKFSRTEIEGKVTFLVGVARRRELCDPEKIRIKLNRMALVQGE